MSDKNKRDADGELKTRDRVKAPRMWKVLIYNDDYTTMEFVVYLLQSVFRHSPAAASRIMCFSFIKRVWVLQERIPAKLPRRA